MKPGAHPRGPGRRAQFGTAAVELAVIIGATIILLPAVALFARVFYQYSVMKEATRDAATYLATLPEAAIKNDTERARVIAIAQRMVAEAAGDAGMAAATKLSAVVVSCDDHPCNGLVPDNLEVAVTFDIDDAKFAALTGDWTNEAERVWEITAKATIPFSK